jgi:hypothetical protein
MGMGHHRLYPPFMTFVEAERLTNLRFQGEFVRSPTGSFILNLDFC